MRAHETSICILIVIRYMNLMIFETILLIFLDSNLFEGKRF